METNAIVPTQTTHLQATPRLVEAFLAGRTQTTLRAYRADFADFAAWVGAIDSEEAVQVLIANGNGQANGLALGYRNHLLERALSPATVNRRLAALRSVVKLARTLGVVQWTLEVQGVKSLPYRDTSGPTRSGIENILTALSGSREPKSRRDAAIVHLLHDLGLRRGEVVSLDLEHFDRARKTLSIMGKGRTERSLLTLPQKTLHALLRWLEVRGECEGPLFLSFDRRGSQSRLCGRSIHRIIRRLGAEQGLDIRPHGLRHSAITQALELTKGDLRRVQRFSRHADPRTLMLYDDNRTDIAGEIADLVAKGHA